MGGKLFLHDAHYSIIIFILTEYNVIIKCFVSSLPVLKNCSKRYLNTGTKEKEICNFLLKDVT